jgi:16S rRNA (guanine966-N2)-methyltransferase
VIAGRWRGRRFPVADVEGLRPTGDRLRETLFNWLGPGIQGARCLDLFAGSGALGIEALSRGAASCDFIERDARAAAALRDVLGRLDADGARVYEEDGLRWLASVEASYDIVFLDPPFGQTLAAPALERLREGHLAPGALVYIEYPRGDAPPVPDGLEVHREKNSGAVGISLLRATASS